MLAGIASIKMATVSQYFEALERSVTEEGHRFPVLKDDLFPCNTNWLSDGGVKFWTGFYSSREVCMRSIVHICVCDCNLFTCLARLFRYVSSCMYWRVLTILALHVCLFHARQNTKFGASRLSAQLRSAEIMQVATLPFTSSANITGTDRA